MSWSWLNIAVHCLTQNFPPFSKYVVVLPQAAQLSIFFIGKSLWLFKYFSKENKLCCTSVRDLIIYAILNDREDKKKAQHPAAFAPMTSLSRGVCSTTVLQPLPYFDLLTFGKITSKLSFPSLQSRQSFIFLQKLRDRQIFRIPTSLKVGIEFKFSKFG